MKAALVAALAALGAVLATMPSSSASLRRLGSSASQSAARGHAGQHLVAAISVALVLAVLVGRARLGIVLVAGALLLYVVRRLVTLSRLRRLRRKRQRMVIRLCDALSAELRAGLPAGTAVVRSCTGVPDLAPVAAAARIGADIPDTMRSCSRLPGGEGIRALAAAWEVTGSSGASLAAVLERVAAGLRSDDEARAEVEAALGPPRATAKMLAALPLFGIGLGQSMGADPLSFLFGSSWGLGCLGAATVLALAGVWWIELLAAAAER